MGQGRVTGIGYRGITCVLQTHVSSCLFISNIDCIDVKKKKKKKNANFRRQE